MSRDSRNQWRRVGFWRLGAKIILDPPLLISFHPLPLEVGALEVGPLNPLGGLRERYKLPIGVRDEAPAANDFGAF